MAPHPKKSGLSQHGIITPLKVWAVRRFRITDLLRALISRYMRVTEKVTLQTTQITGNVKSHSTLRGRFLSLGTPLPGPSSSNINYKT